MTAVAIPSQAPAALVKLGLWRCGFCASNNHLSCPHMVRNGRVRLSSDGRDGPPTGPYRLVQCFCCGANAPRRCLDCGNTNSEDVSAASWQCLFKPECEARLEARKRQSRLFQQLQACRSDAAIRRKADRKLVSFLWDQIPLDEDQLLDEVQQQIRNGRRPTSGSCECCGEPTKGGRFRPGHDARHKRNLRARASQGDVVAQTELEQRGWT